MKVALVHDYIKEYGGAERVLEALHEIYPESPIYTLLYLPEFLGPHRQRIEKWDVRSVIPSWVPFLSKITSPMRLLAPILFGRLDLSAYDLVVVSSTGAYNPNLVKTKPGAHFCYCHTPPRYLYGLPTAREWTKHWWIRIPAQIANHFLRLVDFKSAQRVDHFIANSQNTARRIEKFYRRDAIVIYPPTDVNSIRQIGGRNSKLRNNRSYFLTGGRLARSKRIDLAVVVCTKLDLPLKVFGRMFAGYGEELKKMAGPTVEFLGEVTEEEKANLFAGCKAFIFPAPEEDFGIVPVEAMAFGKPVIALRSGGVVESVVEGKTGVFFGEPTVESLIEAIKQLSHLNIKPEACIVQAQKFSKERFVKEIEDFVEKKHA